MLEKQHITSHLAPRHTPHCLPRDQRSAVCGKSKPRATCYQIQYFVKIFDVTVIKDSDRGGQGRIALRYKNDPLPLACGASCQQKLPHAQCNQTQLAFDLMAGRTAQPPDLALNSSAMMHHATNLVASGEGVAEGGRPQMRKSR